MASIAYTRVERGTVYEARFDFWDCPEDFAAIHEQLLAEEMGIA